MQERSEPPQPQDAWQLRWGRLLRQARQIAGLSLNELSAITGLSKGYLSKLESGHAEGQNPSRATLAALARALPSFRPLARTLEPVADLDAFAFGTSAMQPPTELLMGINDAASALAPVRLGWRELEVVIAILTLERASLAQPLTAVVLARAIGRPLDQVQPTLRRLVAMRVLAARSPTRLGGAITYQRDPTFDERVGLTHLGDALVLAAALLAQSTLPEHQGKKPGRRPATADNAGTADANGSQSA